FAPNMGWLAERSDYSSGQIQPSLLERFQVSDQRRAHAGIGHAGIWHAIARNDRFRVRQVLVQVLRSPDDAAALHRAGEAEAVDFGRPGADDAEQGRADAVAAFFDCVTGSAFGI